ncbi:RxLR effector protein [Phytophthora megakarya]|uniref:RxLR effector protein n=1 Tax=Phytophthora megakarya TaxID=4795 RepID=A0A225UU74_9STRA|nr:RxLR effector protein [Phytophthora megakarya]
MDSVTPSNDRVKRFLRANKSGKDNEERVAPGTGLLDFTKTASWKTLDDVAADLAAILGSSKFVKPIENELDWTMIKIAIRKLTPEDLETKLNIAVKRATMSDEQLSLDPGYLLWKKYKEFWDARKAPA